MKPNLYAALAAAQGELRNPGLDKVNTHFKSSYTSLPEVLDTVRLVFSRHGLAVLQKVGTEGPVVSVETMIVHASGESEGSTMARPVEGNIQQVAAAITYMRRYGLLAMCGLAGREDDDAESVVAPERAQEARPRRPKPPTLPEYPEAPRDADGALPTFRTVTVADWKVGQSEKGTWGRLTTTDRETIWVRSETLLKAIDPLKAGDKLAIECKVGRSTKTGELTLTAVKAERLKTLN